MSDSTIERPLVEAELARPADSGSRAEEARRTGYRSRFAAIYLVLAVVTGAAIGGFVVLLASPKPGPPPSWSAFEPEGTVNAKLFQIINTVPQRYKGEDGQQLVAASVDTPKTSVVMDGQNVVFPVDRIELNEGGNITTIRTGGSLQFTLCGTGEACSIAPGDP